MKNIFSHLESYKSNIALLDNEKNKVLTYKDLLEETYKLSTFFEKKKKLVILFSDNSIEFIISYVTCLNLNFTIMLIDLNIKQEELNLIIKKFKAGYILTSTKLRLNQKIKHQLIRIGNINIYKIIRKDNIIKNKNLSLLLPTSGSTGEKKFVKLTNTNLLTNTIDISRALKVNKFDRAITTLNPYYSYGLSIINSHLFNGASIIINKRNLLDQKFWQTISDLKPNNFGAVPYMIEILKRINFGNLRKINLRYISQAGGPLSENLKLELLKFIKNKKIKIFFMYGQTEASPRITILPFKYLFSHYNSVGLPIGKNKIFIKKRNSNKYIKHGEGEILCSGKNIFIGYATNFLALNNTKKIQYLNTGDIGKIDKEGFLYITGRNSRISKLFGTRINLDYLDNNIKKVTGSESVSSILNNKLYIIIKKKNKIKKELIINLIKSKINISKNFINIRYTNKIQRNKDGKILYSKNFI